MLIDDIKQEIKRMRKLDSMESAAQDAERRQKNDADFTSLVLSFTASMERQNGIMLTKLASIV